LILGLFTGLLSPGGIERIGRHVGAVLASFAKEKGEICRLLSLNDPIGVHDLEVNGIQFSIEGFNRKKPKFLLAVAAIAAKVRIAYIGHVNLAPLNFLLRLFNCRSVVATHGIEVWGTLYWWRRLALRLASRLTAPSTFTAQKLVTLQGIKPESITIIPWALDPGFSLMACEEVAQRPEFPSGRILLTVARLTPGDRDKGIETVIQAFRYVRESFSDVFYIILGDGDDRIRLEHVAKEIGVNDQVIFAGHVSDNELKAYYQKCDIFVMPSRKEGFGLVFIEAMAFGKPVIGGKHAGTLDVIVEGETGFMVEYGDVPELAQCLIRLLEDEALRRRLGEGGRRRVHALYNFNRFKKELIDVLNGEGD